MTYVMMTEEELTVSREAIEAKAGERVHLGDNVYATAGAKYQYWDDGAVFRQFLWVTDAQGRPYPIASADGREEWQCVKAVPIPVLIR
ncbi:hypothetical protein ACWJKU_01425 [Methylocaldum sp. MU1018]